MNHAMNRFFAKVQKTKTCWRWVGAGASSGYGQFYFDGKKYPAHRWLYSVTVEPIPKELFACHSCNNKWCVNPKHIYPATNTKNIHDAIRDGLWGTNQFQNRKRCIKGHAFSPTSERKWAHKSTPGKIRRCRICNTLRMRRVRAEAKAASTEGEASK